MSWLGICRDLQPVIETLGPLMQRYKELGVLIANFGAGSSNQLHSDWRVRAVLGQHTELDVIHPSHRTSNLAEAESRILDQVLRDLERAAK
ncbi:MAG: hypothetical protein ACREXS_13330 [Gammaproteobacteria bacterium]